MKKVKKLFLYLGISATTLKIKIWYVQSNQLDICLKNKWKKMKLSEIW